MPSINSNRMHLKDFVTLLLYVCHGHVNTSESPRHQCFWQEGKRKLEWAEGEGRPRQARDSLADPKGALEMTFIPTQQSVIGRG